jgi:hypothetical protein
MSIHSNMRDALGQRNRIRGLEAPIIKAHLADKWRVPVKAA